MFSVFHKVKVLEDIFKFLFGKGKKLKVKHDLRNNTKTIAGNVVSILLKRKYPNASIHILDSVYSVPIYQDFEDWLEVDTLNLKLYVKDKYDCDNYAMDSFCRAHNIVGNISYGVAISSKPAHVFNVLITQDFVVRPIESQSDMISNYPEEFVYLIII